jgi:CTP synthase
MTRFVFITGGVVSSLGKGLSAAALAALLQARGYSVRLRKLDPYLNVDPGTMSPYQHGECYVTDDGAETDLDLGHYERFTGVPSRQTDNVTSGRIYSDIIKKERRGDYLGGTVQVIPHVTNAIKDFIASDIDADTDFVMCEVGGTIGDIESTPFLEAIRQFGNDHRGQVVYIHVTLVPYLAAAGELKTKPTQHSVKELRSIGIQPDVLICRTEHEIPDNDRRKIALFCNVPEGAVIQALDASSIYEVPLNYHAEGLDTEVLRAFNVDPSATDPDLTRWHEIMEHVNSPEGVVTVGVVGKYIELQDAYKSMMESLTHGGFANNTKVKLHWVNAREINDENAAANLEKVDAIIVPGGFGEGGSEGKIAAAKYARIHKVPYLGICFGMQMACVEYARNVAGMSDAGSTEFGDFKDPIVGLITEWEEDGIIHQRGENDDKGGTMRLGAYKAKLEEGSLVHEVYGNVVISERHRHRYEVNINYREKLEKAGLKFSGLSPDGQLPEIVEIQDHPWFIGVQFHPELKSKPFEPHPLFASFIKAALEKSRLV